ncbi:MAG: hypothetical protein QM724_05140 [Flavobacteriales bacterium]
MGRALSLLTALLCAMLAQAQADSTWMRYQAGFAFREGVYFNFQAFRTNAPSVPKKDLLTQQGQPVTDLRATNGKLTYPDSTGARVKMDLDDLWGFCDNGVVHVRAGNGFSRIGLMGSISHLLFDATYRDWTAYSYGPVTYTVEVQRFLDMESGAFLPVTAGGLYEVLKRDDLLKQEFDALPKKQRNKEETIFLFMRRYNERHPLYFPR